MNGWKYRNNTIIIIIITINDDDDGDDDDNDTININNNIFKTHRTADWKKKRRKKNLNEFPPSLSGVWTVSLLRQMTDRTEGSEKGSPPIHFACFSCVYFAPAPVIFFALPFYSWNLVPAFQVQINVFQSVLTSTCEKQEGMQNKY